LKIKLLIHQKEQVKLIFPSLLLLLIFLLAACQNNPLNITDQSRQSVDNTSRLSTQLTLNNAVLEQSNQEGNQVWKIKAQQTTYSDDRKVGYLENITANLLENQQIVLKIQGKKGEVREQGNLILLQEDIVVNDVRNQSVLRGNLAEWRPLENILSVKENLQANHPNLIVTANTAKYSTNTESLELIGQVVANTLEPSLLLKSDRLNWQIPQQKFIVNSSLNLVRYQNDTITDRLVADTGEINLQQQIVTLQNNVELNSLKPQLQIATNSATWNYQKRLINSQQPIQIIARSQQLDITGNQGQVDLTTEIATLNNGVKGINNRDAATLYAQQAIWNMSQQEVVATGNVTYKKTQPKVDLTGDRAVIQLDQNKAIVTSDRPLEKPVVSVVSRE
jgi:LPS export ABC transporter protein LptC